MTENPEKTIAALNALERIVETAQQLYEIDSLTAVIKTHHTMNEPGVILEDEQGNIVVELVNTESVKTIVASEHLRDTRVDPTMRPRLYRSIVTPVKTIRQARANLEEAVRKTRWIQRRQELTIAVLRVVTPIVQSDKPRLKITAHNTLQSFSDDSLKSMVSLSDYTEMRELVNLGMGIGEDGEIDMLTLMQQVCLIDIGETD